MASPGLIDTGPSHNGSFLRISRGNSDRCRGPCMVRGTSTRFAPHASRLGLRYRHLHLNYYSADAVERKPCGNSAERGGLG